MIDLPELTYTKIYMEMARIRAEGVWCEVLTTNAGADVYEGIYTFHAHCTGAWVDYYLITRREDGYNYERSKS